MLQAKTPQRYVVFDTVRGVAVLLAMLDHVKVQFVPDLHVLVPLTRLATPVFIILFGVMIELAYLSKLRAGAEPFRVRQRMVSRMLTCFALFAALTVAAMFSGNLGLSQGMKGLVGLDAGRFNEILLIYALLFALVLALLPALQRYGARLVLALAALAWGLKGLAAGFEVGETPYIVTFFTGIGEGYGPALLPALTFLGFGLALGEGLTMRGRMMVPVVLVILAGGICMLELSNGFMEAGRRFLAHRWTSHPAYFAVGIMGFAGMTLLLLVVERSGGLSRISGGLALVGAQSLFIYGGGNLVLNLIPVFEIARPAGIALAAAFLAALPGFALIRAQGRDHMGRFPPGRHGAEPDPLNRGWLGQNRNRSGDNQNKTCPERG